MRIEKVLLYDEGVPETLGMREIAGYLTEKLGNIPIEIRGNPFASYPDKSRDFARKLASIKIEDVNADIPPAAEPLYGEIQYEERRITGKTKAFGVLYDGVQLQNVFWEIVPRDERVLGFLHLFFTNRLFATWDENDKRYHARTSVYGFPSVISTTGLVEAPAKPREFYVLKQQYDMLGKDLLALKERFKGSFVDYDDERLTEIMKGYAMQAVFYPLTGDPFCQDKGCRLYNAHWQEELIFAHLGSEYEFCREHRRILDNLHKG